MLRDFLKLIPLAFFVLECTAAFIFCIAWVALILGAIGVAAYALVILAAYGVTGQLWSV